jgi:hypothetical protein
MGFDLWFQSETDRAKRETEFHRTNSDDSIWFVALAKEQLALVTHNGFHGNSFLLTGFNWRKASVMLRPPIERILFSGQVQPAPKVFGASLYLPAFQK